MNPIVVACLLVCAYAGFVDPQRASGAPANHNFANRITLSGQPVSTTGSNVGATSEDYERFHLGNTAGKSVWWTWTAPYIEHVTIDSSASSFASTLVIYIGNALDLLDPLLQPDDFHGYTSPCLA